MKSKKKGIFILILILLLFFSCGLETEPNISDSNSESEGGPSIIKLDEREISMEAMLFSVIIGLDAPLANEGSTEINSTITDELVNLYKHVTGRAPEYLVKGTVVNLLITTKNFVEDEVLVVMVTKIVINIESDKFPEGSVEVIINVVDEDFEGTMEELIINNKLTLSFNGKILDFSDFDLSKYIQESYVKLTLYESGTENIIHQFNLEYQASYTEEFVFEPLEFHYIIYENDEGIEETIFSIRAVNQIFDFSDFDQSELYPDNMTAVVIEAYNLLGGIGEYTFPKENEIDEGNKEWGPGFAFISTEDFLESNYKLIEYHSVQYEGVGSLEILEFGDIGETIKGIANIKDASIRYYESLEPLEFTTEIIDIYLEFSLIRGEDVDFYF